MVIESVGKPCYSNEHRHLKTSNTHQKTTRGEEEEEKEEEEEEEDDDDAT